MLFGLVFLYDFPPKARDATPRVGMPVGVDYVMDADQPRAQRLGQQKILTARKIAVVAVDEHRVIIFRQLLSRLRRTGVTHYQIERLPESSVRVIKGLSQLLPITQIDRRNIDPPVLLAKYAGDVPLYPTAHRADREQTVDIVGE